MTNTIKNKLLNNFNSFDATFSFISEDVVIENQKIFNFEKELSLNDEIINIFNEFFKFISNHLNLNENLPKIQFLYNKHPNMTYGSFLPDSNEILVLCKNRGLADVLRTSAHELVHYKQKLDNKIPEIMTKRNTELESEANTKAGDIVYMFGLKFPKIYEFNFSDNVEEI